MIGKFDPTTLLDQTFFGIDTLSMLGDVQDFIEFSEANIGWQQRRERRRTEKECDDADIDDPRLKAQYRDQRLEGVRFRFEVSLTQRVRYAALTTLITTIEWTLVALEKRAAFEFPAKARSTNEAVHVLRVFNEKADLALEQDIQLLETLIQVRNCVVHAAGLLQSYQYESELRQRLTSVTGVKVSNLNFLGDGIEIEAGFLEDIVQAVSLWLPRLEQTVWERGFVRKGGAVS